MYKFIVLILIALLVFNYKFIEGYSTVTEVDNYGYFEYDDLLKELGHTYYTHDIFGGYPNSKYLYAYHPYPKMNHLLFNDTL